MSRHSCSICKSCFKANGLIYFITVNHIHVARIIRITLTLYSHVPIWNQQMLPNHRVLETHSESIIKHCYKRAFSDFFSIHNKTLLPIFRSGSARGRKLWKTLKARGPRFLLRARDRLLRHWAYAAPPAAPATSVWAVPPPSAASADPRTVAQPQAFWPDPRRTPL